MALRYSAAPRPFFAPMALAAQYCQGVGVELGAAAHNDFQLPGSVNLAPTSDDPNHPDYLEFQHYAREQEKLCGAHTLIDLNAEAHEIPLPEHTQDYIISSHVIEHLPNLIQAFLEWDRVLKPGGIVLMIFPMRNAHPNDVNRELTPLQHLIDDFSSKYTVETHPLDGVPGGRRGHYHVFTLQSMLDLIDWCNRSLELGWEVIATEERDSKVGNGHTVVCRTREPMLLVAPLVMDSEPERAELLAEHVTN